MSTTKEPTISDLDEDRRRTLLSRLIKGGDLKGLGEEYQLTIPNRMTVSFTCPSCLKDFSNRLMTKDMQGMKKYVTCPECKKKAYLDNIAAPKDAARVELEGLEQFI